VFSEFYAKGDKMRVVIGGDRNWSDEKTIDKYIKTLPPNSMVIHGDGRGVDKIAGRMALKHGHSVMAVPANWEKFGKSAGPIRNQHMLTPRPDLVVVFHNDLENSKGTKDMIMRANKMGVRVEIRTSASTMREKT